MRFDPHKESEQPCRFSFHGYGGSRRPRQIPVLDPHSSFTPQHIISLFACIHSWIYRLSSQHQVAIPDATSSIARALDQCSPAGSNNSCLERVCRSVGGVVGTLATTAREATSRVYSVHWAEKRSRGKEAFETGSYFPWPLEQVRYFGTAKDSLPRSLSSGTFPSPIRCASARSPRS